MRNNQATTDVDGRITHLVLCRAVGLGWTSCGYARTRQEAERRARDLADDDGAWMPDTAARDPEERLRDWVRVATVLEFAKERPIGDSIVFAINQHNRDYPAHDPATCRDCNSSQTGPVPNYCRHRDGDYMSFLSANNCD